MEPSEVGGETVDTTTSSPRRTLMREAPIPGASRVFGLRDGEVLEHDRLVRRAVRLVLAGHELQRERLRADEADTRERPRLAVRAVELVIVDSRVVVDDDRVGTRLELDHLLARAVEQNDLV